jgi:hypothetical protein
MLDGKRFFSICGAPKAGTTSLYAYLDDHPEICMSTPKETHFFQGGYDKGMEWFKTCFDPDSRMQAWGEASAGNMIHPKAAERIARHFPDARLVFVLRNPIDRAYSQCWYEIRRGTDRGIDHLQRSFSEVIRNPDRDDWAQRILDLGLYHEQLRRFERHFDRDQMFIGQFERLKEDGEGFFRRVQAFIGVDPSKMPETSTHHGQTYYPRNVSLMRGMYALWRPLEDVLPNPVVESTRTLRSSVRELLFQSGSQEKPTMAPEDRTYLRDYYEEPNRRLEEWLGRDLSHWT